MSFRRYKNCVYISSFVLILLIFTLLCGCVGTDLPLHGNNSSIPVSVGPGTITTLPVTTYSTNQSVKTPEDNKSSETSYHNQLENAWKTLRVINADENERFLKLDLSKSDDINYLRFLLIPETVTRLEKVRSDLSAIKPVNSDERNETKALIEITNYTILKYEGLSTVMHATQYVSIGDPIKMKAELREAKFQIMDAIDIINEREISDYPSLYRDQVAADKRELDDMASQVDSFTRTVYLNSQF
jgi:hypothetical protein